MRARRVLVIDDEADIREVVRLSLELTAGWEVVEAAGGAEGVAAARRARPDAILLDLMMPGMDGLATARALADAPETRGRPVILLTAKPRAGDAAAAPPGVTAVLAKPFDPLTLHEHVAALLGW